MKLKSLLYFLMIAAWIGCDNDSSNQEWADVTYISPMYASVSTLADEITTEDPKAQTC